MDNVLHSIHSSGASTVKHRQASAEWCEGVNGTSVLQLREAVGGGGVRHDLHTDPAAGQLLWLQTVGGNDTVYLVVQHGLVHPIYGRCCVFRRVWHVFRPWALRAMRYSHRAPLNGELAD